VSAPLHLAGQVLPSVMSADPMRAGEQIDALLAAGARIFHVDVMDGHFVPNLTLGSDFTRALAERVHAAGGLVDVHMMVERPGALIGLFAPHADLLSVHVEADPHPHRLIDQIRAAGCRPGLALNPGTPVQAVLELGEDLDFVNVLAIDPGFSGQVYIGRTDRRIAALRAGLPSEVAIEVDGGIDGATLPRARAAGASLLVSASAIFRQADPVAAYAALAGAAAP
jgi:ribulose-phosphate 3-epimerase